MTVDRVKELTDRISKLKDEAWDYHDNHGYPNNRLEDQIADESFALRQLLQVREIFKK